MTLAVSGGPGTVPENLIKPWPWITDEDKCAVVDAMDEAVPWRRPFPQVSALCEEWAAYTGRKYCMGVNSGTASLHTAVRAAGVTCGDEVIAPAFAYLGSIAGIVHANAIPIFADVEQDTGNLDSAGIEERITPRTRAIIAVDLHGIPADYDAITAVAARHDLIVIEDGAQAHGARYKDRMVGGLGHISGCSLNGSKPLSALCEGGLLSTDDPEAMRRAERLICFDEVAEPGAEGEHDAHVMAYNYRMDNLQAAFARSQLRRLDETVAHRQRNCEHLAARLREIPGIEVMPVPEYTMHAYFFIAFKVRPDQLDADFPTSVFREALSTALQAEGVNARRWQTAILPDMAMIAYKNAYGKGCPWSCAHAQDIDYHAQDYPVACHWVEDSLVIGHSTDGLGPPNGFELMDAYADGFEKVLVDRRDEFLALVEKVLQEA